MLISSDKIDRNSSSDNANGIDSNLMLTCHDGIGIVGVKGVVYLMVCSPPRLSGLAREVDFTISSDQFCLKSPNLALIQIARRSQVFKICNVKKLELATMV